MFEKYLLLIIYNYKSTFELSNRVVHFDNFIKNHGRNKTLRKVTLSIFNFVEDIDSTIEKNEEENTEETTFNEKGKTNLQNYESTLINKTKIKINENANSCLQSNEKIREDDLKITERTDINVTTCPLSNFEKLNESYQILVHEAKQEIEKKFELGKSLIEGTNGFPKDIELGLTYVKQCNEQKYIDSIIYYTHMLIKGEIIPQDIEQPNECLSIVGTTSDRQVLLLKGKICSKMDENLKQ